MFRRRKRRRITLHLREFSFKARVKQVINGVEETLYVVKLATDEHKARRIAFESLRSRNYWVTHLELLEGVHSK